MNSQYTTVPTCLLLRGTPAPRYVSIVLFLLSELVTGSYMASFYFLLLHTSGRVKSLAPESYHCANIVNSLLVKRGTNDGHLLG